MSTVVTGIAARGRMPKKDGGKRNFRPYKKAPVDADVQRGKEIRIKTLNEFIFIVTFCTI